MSTHPLHEGRARTQPTPARRDWVGTFLSIWESEGVLSWRLVAATALVVFALVMRGTGRMSTEDSLKYLGVAVELAALGTLKVIASRFSPKPTVDSTQQPDAATT